MSLRAQLALLAVAAVCLPLVVVFGSGLVMFGMHDEPKFWAVAGISALCALALAVLLGRHVLKPLAELRDASARLSAGDLSARASESGPRELREVGAAFNEMASNVEKLFDARRELVTWASHDLRTPLASLRAMVETLEDGLAEPHEYLPAIRAQTEILSTLVEDLFELARIDSGLLALEVCDTPLRALIDGCLEALGGNVEARIDADPVVTAAPEKVQRVLLNLLANALRHTGPEGSVAVVVQTDTDHALVAIEDEGDGLGPGVSQRMFERFWRDDGSRTRASGGAGLGLSIAQGLVHAHGGTIWAENRSEGGARVVFTLPLASTAEQTAVVTASSEAAAHR
jgi:two-component system sensor histidine kinase BaeS